MPTDADSTSRGKNSCSSQESSRPPEGFFIAGGVVPEEAWEEIRTHLGLYACASPFGRDATQPRGDSDRQRIGMRGFCDGDGGDDGSGGDRNSHVGGVPDPSAATIPWESTPFPQNRPVAQFGFRYDYEKDVVVASAGEGVPRIPGVFRRLLLRPRDDPTTGDADEGGGAGDDDDDDDDNNNNTEARRKIESTRGQTFTQCIVNVYHPTIDGVDRGGGDSSPNDSGSRTNAEATTPTTPMTSPAAAAAPAASPGCTSSIPWHADDPAFGPDILVFSFGETRPLHMRSRLASAHDGDGSYSFYTAHPSHGSCYLLSGPARHLWEHSVPPGSDWRVSITFRTLCTQ